MTNLASRESESTVIITTTTIGVPSVGTTTNVMVKTSIVPNGVDIQKRVAEKIENLKREGMSVGTTAPLRLMRK